MSLQPSPILFIGILILLLDILIFFTFVSRVHISFNKRYSIDEEWNQNNDFWLKLSRISGVIFSFFHIGIMCIIILQTTTQNNLFDNNYIAHIYLFSQSLWILFMNLAIVSISHRMFRVYKSTSTSFTPFKAWMASHGHFVEIFIWAIYALIVCAILSEHILIITFNQNYIYLINAFRSLCSAIILFVQLIIALFFCYIAHKSHKQTIWNEQSKAIICKESAKLAFIVCFLAFFMFVLLYTMSWYLWNYFYKNDHSYSLNSPFRSINHRIHWAIFEFLGFWLISYLTRLRKPASNNQMSKRSLLQRTLSSKKTLRRIKSQKLEERKQNFLKRESKRMKNGYFHVSTHSNANANAFNHILMKQVAKYEEETKENELRISDIRKSKSVNHENEQKDAGDDDGDMMNEKEYSQTRPRYNRMHIRMNQSDPLLHMTLGHFMMKEINQNKLDLDILEESKMEIPTKQIEESDSFKDNESEKIPLTKHDSIKTANPETAQNAHYLSAQSPRSRSKSMLTPEPIAIHNVYTPNMTNLPSPSDQSVTSVESPTTTMAMDIGQMITQKYTFSQQLSRNKPVSVIITPAQTPIAQNGYNDDDDAEIVATFWNDNNALTETDEDDSNLNEFECMESDQSDATISNDTNVQKHTNDDGVHLDVDNVDFNTLQLSPLPTPKSGFSKMWNKMSAALTPQKSELQSSFPSVRVLSDAQRSGSDHEAMGYNIQFNAIPSVEDTCLSPTTEQIVDLYLDAFKLNENENENEEKNDLLSEYVANNHNIHLQPTSLKRSHSDPDIRVKDKIWQQLLVAFKQNMKQNQMEKVATNRVDRTGSVGTNDRPQLSMTNDEKFHLFELFNDDKAKKQKNESRKSSKNSLEIPTMNMPLEPIYSSNKEQATYIKLDSLKKNDLSMNNMNRQKSKSVIHKKKKKRSKKRKRKKSKVQEMAANLEKHGELTTDVVMFNKIKRRNSSKRELKSRMKRKKQTKEWMNNVYQVF